MELVKNIFFNTDKLVRNSKVKISYTGKLFEENSKDVFLHYGYGNEWENLSEIKMEKTELGYQTEIELISNNNLNLCFRDSNNNWDNNNSQNYSFPIEDVEEISLVPKDTPSGLDTPKRLKRTYIWSKKIKLAVYKLIHYFPKLISGNYRKKAVDTMEKDS